MTQLNLFQSQSAPVEPRPPNPDFVRKHLVGLLRMARQAMVMPWPPAEAKSWAERYPRLAQCLPADEAKALCEAFEKEFARLSET